MSELKVHPAEMGKYDINWVADNCSMVMLNRGYVARHEPTYCGASMLVHCPEDKDWLIEYAHNEDGFLYVSDMTASGKTFEVVSFGDAVFALKENTAKVLLKGGKL